VTSCPGIIESGRSVIETERSVSAKAVVNENNKEQNKIIASLLTLF
jgi:hypothetical protein